MSNARYQLGPSRETSSDVGRIMKRASEIEELSSTPRQRRSKKPLAGVVAAIFLATTTLNVVNTLRGSQAAVDPQGEVTNIRFEIYVAAQNINAYREKNGQLPSNLKMRSLIDDGITYMRHGDTYTLMGMAGEEAVHYADGEDLEAYAAAAERFFGEG